MRRQAGIKPRFWTPDGRHARGLLVRGVVLRTYLPTDPQHPGYVPAVAAVGPVVAGVQVPSVYRQYTPGMLKAALCDVLPYSRKYRAPPMLLVPVVQNGGWGRSDVAGGWTPMNMDKKAILFPALDSTICVYPCLSVVHILAGAL